jgi:hypothetical protein
VVPIAADWATISSLATAGGTLVLAFATFAAVRSSNRSARLAEVALQEQRRPLLVPSRLDDPVQKIMFVEGRWVRAAGGRAAAEHEDGNVYLAISLRNVGAGIAVCQGWVVSAGFQTSRMAPTHRPLDDFRVQTRDLYIPAGDIGMWQGAIRDHGEAAYDQVAEAISEREPISIELLYSDQVGEQRTITRFGLMPYGEENDWIANVSRHWNLDRPGPRSEAQAEDAAARILESVEAARAEAEAAPTDDGVSEQLGNGPAPREITRD